MLCMNKIQLTYIYPFPVQQAGVIQREQMLTLSVSFSGRSKLNVYQQLFKALRLLR